MGAGTDYTSTESTDAGSIVQVIKQLHPVEFTDSSTGLIVSFGTLEMVIHRQKEIQFITILPTELLWLP